MANGQQKAQQNLDAFQAWVATQQDDDFKAITEAPSHSHRRNSYLVELLKR